MKRKLLLCLTVLFALSVVAFMSACDNDNIELEENSAENNFVEHGYDEFGFEYTLLEDRSGYEVSRGNANLNGVVTLPDYYCDLPVKKLADSAFRSRGGAIYTTGVLCNSVTTQIILPAYLETLGDAALSCMLKLEEIVIPDSVKEIGAGAFLGDIRLKHVTLPKALKIIGGSAFFDTPLDELVLPDGLEEIGDNAFAFPHRELNINSDLPCVVIPDSVKRIGTGVFQWRDKLADVVMSQNIQEFGYDVFADTLWYELQPEGFIFFGKLLYGYKGEMPENYVLTIPSNVKYIAGGAFLGQTNLQKIIIPDGVKLSGSSVFTRCTSLTEITLPSDLEDLPQHTFNSCVSLEKIILPVSLKTTGSLPFGWENFTTIYYEGSLSDWEALVAQNNGKFGIVYVYSAERPAAAGSYWHYVNGEAVIWE